jgi:signal peptidase I
MTRLPIAPGPRRFALVVALVAILFYFFVIRGAQFFYVPTTSMLPTLLPGDRVVTLRAWHYRRGDLVVVPDPDNGDFLVKRIAGVGGDRLAVREGALFLNDEYAPEPYVLEPMAYALESPIIVPEGELFLLGDNRNHSDDSVFRQRTWPEDTVVGRAVWCYYPWARFGALPRYPLGPIRELLPPNMARPAAHPVESPPNQDDPAS